MNINKYQGSQSGIEHIVLIYFFFQKPFVPKPNIAGSKNFFIYRTMEIKTISGYSKANF